MAKRSARERSPKSPDTPAHRLQEDPPEGSREVIESELRRQDKELEKDMEAEDREGKPEVADIADRTAGLP